MSVPQRYRSPPAARNLDAEAVPPRTRPPGYPLRFGFTTRTISGFGAGTLFIARLRNPINSGRIITVEQVWVWGFNSRIYCFAKIATKTDLVDEPLVVRGLYSDVKAKVSQSGGVTAPPVDSRFFEQTCEALTPMPHYIAVDLNVGEAFDVGLIDPANGASDQFAINIEWEEALQ